MAVNDMVVRIIGDSRSVERAFARSSNAATQFGRSVDTTGTKLDKQTKRFSGFAKGAAVGFGGAFALTETINVIKNLATVAAESEQILGQTRVALESTGKSWAVYGKQIEDTVKEQSRLGFDDETLLQTFSQFQRTTGDVSEALRLNNLAMDVARARFIDLEQAAALVTKAAIGNAGALRRLGIDAKVGSSSVELLTLLTEKYGGSAEAAADDSSTGFARTQVAVENLQESLGRLLLPALNKLAGSLEEIAVFADNVTTALGKIGDVKIPEIEIPFLVTIGGQSVGDAAGSLLSKAKFTPLNPLFGVTVANAIADQFRDQARAATPTLAASISASMEQMTADALATSRFGITTLPDSGENLARDVGSSIREAIDRAQAEAAKATAAGRTAIAKDKAADAAAKAVEDAAKAAEAARDRAFKEAAKRASARAKEQARQFRALGLAATGDEIVPGIQNLRTRISGALRRIQSGDLDVSSKVVDRLKLARKLIKREGGKLTEDTRRVIDGQLKAIQDSSRKADATLGPISRTSALNANKILDGLGLGRDMERELRARLSSFNSAGIALAGSARPTGGFRGTVPVTQTNVTVELDGQVVARSVTRNQQKTKRRNPVQKRGSRRGGV